MFKTLIEKISMFFLFILGRLVKCHECGEWHDKGESGLYPWVTQESDQWLCHECEQEIDARWMAQEEAYLEAEWKREQVRLRELDAIDRLREKRDDPQLVEAQLNALWVDTNLDSKVEPMDEVTLHEVRISMLDARLRDDDLFITHDAACEFNFRGHEEPDVEEDIHSPNPNRYCNPVDERTWMNVRAS